LVLTQIAPQIDVPPAHVAEHVPFAQTWPAGHAVPQAPQFVMSVASAVHAAPQSAVPEEQLVVAPSLAGGDVASATLASLASIAVDPLPLVQACERKATQSPSALPLRTRRRVHFHVVIVLLLI
jgi:hypothetical protein